VGAVPPAVRVVVADDHQLVRVGLASLFRATGDLEVVGQAADGREAVQLAVDLVPDVVVMDLSMPVLDGVAATRLVREQCPETNVLIFTAFCDRARIAAALRAGAMGYALKDIGPEQLLAAVRGAAGRGLS
jgi:DNA-binding NarL/FixJ family response regulator